MARVKGGNTSRKRHKKILKMAKGYFGSKHRLYRTANEQVMHSLRYAYRDRRQKKRDFRKLWITRINAACRMNGISYSKFINGLSKANIGINRKMLAEMAVSSPDTFASFVEAAKAGLDGKKIPAAKAMTSTPKVETVKKAPAKKATVKKEIPKVVAKKETVKEDISKLTVADLKKLATEKGIKGISKMKKAELIDALK